MRRAAREVNGQPFKFTPKKVAYDALSEWQAGGTLLSTEG